MYQWFGLPLRCTGINLVGSVPSYLATRYIWYSYPFWDVVFLNHHGPAESFVKFAVSGYSAQENRSSWPQYKKHMHNMVIQRTYTVLARSYLSEYMIFEDSSSQRNYICLTFLFISMKCLNFPFLEYFVFYFWISVLDTGALSFHTKHFYPVFKNLNDLCLVKMGA